MFATFLAPCLKPLYQLVTDAVGQELGSPTRLVDGRSLQQVRGQEVHFAFVCGLPYVRLRREDPTSVDAIAAPVVFGDRYGGRPIYFSDVIVPRDSKAASWRDLRGGSWAYNEPDSHSGYLTTLFRLTERAETMAYFSRWEATGFHERSIRLVADGLVDATAIDSHVLAIALRDHPEHRDRVKVIDVLGPSTIQPLVATGAVAESLKRDVQEIVINLHNRAAQRERLTEALVEKFIHVDDDSYADIRRMLAAAEAADLC